MNAFIKAGVLACTVAGALVASSVQAQPQENIGAAVFSKKGDLLLPQGYRQWVFIGAPLTPHGLNNGKAGFPEFHHVYVNPDAYAVYQQTGVFPEGTMIVKELVLLQKGDYPDGSKLAPSGRGYFAGAFQGMDVMVKDRQRFASDNGWGFFNFGHQAPPYLPAAQAAPTESCAGCHATNAGKDMVFKAYYPVLH